jgi:hypothetical protein
MRVTRHLLTAGLGAAAVWFSHPEAGARRRRDARDAFARLEATIRGVKDSTATRTTGADALAPTPATLMEVVEAAKQRGMGAEFSVTGAEIHCAACGTDSTPESMSREWVHRLEGASDPDELLSVSALTCPACGAKGLLVLPYGPAADEHEAGVSRRLPDPANADMAPLESLRVAV